MKNVTPEDLESEQDFSCYKKTKDIKHSKAVKALTAETHSRVLNDVACVGFRKVSRSSAQ